MNLTDTHTTINLSIPVARHNYKGPTQPCHIRNGFGIEQWDHQSPQKYQGTFYNNTLHKYGTYEWNYNKQKYIYEGKIYGNNLDGYGLLSYPDGKYFEGLFMYNQRFGPGVLTYPNGNQDVGLWNGTNLVRLSIQINPGIVPNLANSLPAKAYLIQYKKLISVSPRTFSPAKEILEELHASENVINNRHKLYNKYIRNDNSLFFDFDNYDQEYFSDEQQFVDVITQFENGVPKLEQKVVTDILAWNNEEESILILKHTFLNRNFECNLSYSIDGILTGQRNNFTKPGFLENICIEFLDSCCNGDHKRISQLITQYDINPNVCDLIGNYGIHFAAVNNHILSIKNLVNFGTNLDILNDEGLTPLIMCILEYISIKEKVTDWEHAFLPSIIPDVTQEIWRPYISESSDNSNNPIYILDLECKKFNDIFEKKSKIKIQKNKSNLITPKSKFGPSASKSRKSRLKIEDKSVENALQQGLIQDKLDDIYNTILTLLQYGADTNYGEVPLPPLILAIFTKEQNIVLDLIENGADCNITTAYQDGSLTPLHIVTALKITPELIEVAKILLKNGAIPNPKTNIDHWLEEKYIIDPENVCEDQGKTPLHLLTMRYDFLDDNDELFERLYETLVENGSDPNIFYLGHNCLTLAILRGNLGLINTILQSYKVDPNQLLGCNMGVPLTVLILKKYKNMLPLQICKEVYAILTNYDANPFLEIPRFGNAIEFSENENAEEENTKKEVKKKDLHYQIIQFLYNNAEQILNRHIQGYVIKCLYEYRIECDFVDQIFDEMVKFVDINDTVKILQLLLNHDLIKFSENGFAALVKYIERKTRGKKQNKKKKRPESPKTSRLSNLVQGMIKEELPKREINVPIPEIDQDDEKYTICYNCYKKTGKILVLCPKCELVYFCSEECNKLNLKKITKHKCKGIFYNAELKKMLTHQAAGISFEKRMNKFKTYRDEFLSDPEHEFHIKYAFSSAGSQISHLTKSDRQKSKKGISSERSKTSREGSPKKKRRKEDGDSDGGDDKRRGRSKKRKHSSESKITKKSKSKSKERVGSEKKDHIKSKEKDKSKKKDRSRSKIRDKKPKTGKSKDITPTRKDKSKSRKEKSKERPKSKKDTPKSRKAKSEDRSKPQEDKSKSRKDKSKGRSKPREDKSKSRKGKSKERPKSKKDTSKSRKDKSKGRSKTRKDKLRDRSKSSKSGRGKTSKSKTRGKSLGPKSRSQERRPKREPTKPFDKRRDKAPFGTFNKFIQDFSKFERPSLVEKYKGMTSDLSGLLLAMSLNNLLLPCCLLIDGQFYYKFDRTTYCGLNYSHV